MPSFAWWNASFQYRRLLNVTNPNSVNMTDFQDRFVINTKPFISAGKLKADCSDLRIINSTGQLVPLYVMPNTCNTSSTILWSRRQFLLAGTTEQSYIYYGNPSANNIFNPKEVFEFFDDCNGTSMNTTLWDVYSGTVTVSDGMCQLVRSGTDIKFKSKVNFTGNEWALKYRGWHENTDWNAIGFFNSNGLLLNQRFDAGNMTMRINNTVDTALGNVDEYFAPFSEWATYDLRRLPNSTIYVNDILRAYTDTYSPKPIALPLEIWTYNTNQNMSIDWLFVHKIYEEDAVLVFGGEEESLGVDISTFPLYPHANETISLIASGLESGNITHTWWWIENDGGLLHSVEGANYTYNFTNTGVHYVNVTAYDATLSTNQTGETNITVYVDMTDITINVEEYLPYLISQKYENFNFSASGGSPVLNSTWTLELPNSTTITRTTEKFNYTIQNEGIHTIGVSVCDEYNIHVDCLNTSTQFKAWNVTGGRHIITAFNQTPNLLAEVLVGDSVTFNSNSNLNWTLNGTSQVGNQIDLTFSESNWYYNDSNYLYYNVTLQNNWGNFTSNQWFTAIVAKYEVGQTLSCSYNQFCLINAMILSENNGTQLTTSPNYEGVISLQTGYGHNKEWGINTDDYFLNVSLCMNATPLVSSLNLDGTITYIGSTPSQAGEYRTYTFDNVDFLLSSTCTNSNGKNYTFWGIPTTSATDVTITVTRSGTALSNVLVNIQKYLENEDTWVTMTNQLTDVNGQIQLPLQLCANYYKIVIEETGQVIYTEKTCFKSSEYTINLVAEESEYFIIANGVSAYCTFSNSTNYFSCLVSNTGGLTATSELTISYAWGGNVVCSTSESSVSATLLCDMAGFEGNFKYSLEVTSQDSTFIIDSGSFSIGAEEKFGKTGSLLALLFLMLIILTGAFFGLNPLVLIFLSIFSFIVFMLMGWLDIGAGVIGWILALGLLAVWKVVA